MIGWHHGPDGREFEQAPGDGDGRGSLARWSPWGGKESDTTEQLNWASQTAPVVKNLPANSGGLRDASSIPGCGRSPGGRHGNPLQYSCLENPMDRGQSTGSQKVGLTEVTEHIRTHTCMSLSVGETY